MVKRITRSARAEAEGNLVKVDTPAFVSLVGRPANQRPFQVIRSADGKPVKARRGDNAVLMLTFPDDYTEEDAAAALVLFGMDDYTIIVEADVVCAYRSDLQSVAKIEEKNPSKIRLTSDGVVAHVDPKQYAPKEQAKRSIGVAVTTFEFDKKTFDNEKIISWGQQNGVDFSEEDIENSHTDVFSVSRKQVSEGTEVRRMELEPGLTAVVVRDDAADNVPTKYVAAVNEAAYGQWGWGQLDFAAMMADVALCEQLSDANYTLSEVLYQILFWSQLPLDVRKQLVTRCLQQYEAFVHGLIDALPRQVLLLASRADSIKRKESDMAIDKEAAQKELDKIEAAKRAEEEKAAAAKAEADAKEAEAKRAEEEAAAAAAKAKGDDTVTMTRAELTDAIAAGVKAHMEAEAKRAADEKAAADKVAADAAAAEAARAAAAPAAISREDMAAIVADAVAAATKPLTEKIERMENTAVVRSDAGDDAGKQKKEVKRSAFTGVFGNLTPEAKGE